MDCQTEAVEGVDVMERLVLEWLIADEFVSEGLVMEGSVVAGLRDVFLIYNLYCSV